MKTGLAVSPIVMRDKILGDGKALQWLAHNKIIQGKKDEEVKEEIEIFANPVLGSAELYDENGRISGWNNQDAVGNKIDRRI